LNHACKKKFFSYPEISNPSPSAQVCGKNRHKAGFEKGIQMANNEVLMERWLMNNFGRLIRDRRRELGLTQTELAESVNMSQPRISNIERGKGNPTLASIVVIAERLGLQVKLSPKIKRRDRSSS